MTIERPLPVPDDVTQPYWDAAREGRLVAPRCEACGTLFFPPRPRCPSCLASAVTWEELSGGGVVHTFTVVRQAHHPAFADDVPYVLAVIATDEGVHLMSNVVGCPPDDVRVDDRVEVVFDDVSSEVVLPRFRPVAR